MGETYMYTQETDKNTFGLKQIYKSYMKFPVMYMYS